MMNKKGQVLVVFVLILPLILTFLGLIIDIGNSLVIRKKYENIIKDVILYSYKGYADEVESDENILIGNQEQPDVNNEEENLDDNEEENLDNENDEILDDNQNVNVVEKKEIDLNLLQENIKKNIEEYEDVKVDLEENILTVNVKYHYKSIFGTLFNIGLNNIDVKVKYDVENKKIVRE